MTPTHALHCAVATAVLAAALAAGPARALDARYTDAEGDMVADTRPTRASSSIPTR
jgi:hypothetical protein